MGSNRFPAGPRDEGVRESGGAERSMRRPALAWWLTRCVACAGPAAFDGPTPDAGVRCVGPFATLCDGPCTPGTTRCLDPRTIDRCEDGRWVTSSCARGTCRFGAGPEGIAACVLGDACELPDSTRCDGPSVLFCNLAQQEVLLRECAFGCDDSGDCREEAVCPPGRIRCDGGALRRCNAIGSYESTEDCANGCSSTPAPARCAE